MIIKSLKLICDRKIILLVVCSYFVIGCKSHEENKMQTINFTKGNVSIQIPPKWKFSTLTTEEISIDVKNLPKSQYKNFTDQLEKERLFNARMAETVKDNLYYPLLTESLFETKSGVHGTKIIHGRSEKHITAISYYFVNNAEDFIEIELHFRTLWHTMETARHFDLIILNGLTLN